MSIALSYDLVSSVAEPGRIAVVVGYRPGMSSQMTVKAQGSRLLLNCNEGQSFSLEGISDEDMACLSAKPFKLFAFDNPTAKNDLAVKVDLKNIH